MQNIWDTRRLLILQTAQIVRNKIILTMYITLFNLESCKSITLSWGFKREPVKKVKILWGKEVFLGRKFLAPVGPC